MLQIFVIKALISVILFSLALILFVDDSFLRVQALKYNSQQTEVPLPSLNPTKINETKLLFDHCDLAELDPWDPTIQKYLSPLKDPTKNCKPITKEISKLENGQLFLYFPPNLTLKCQRRCLFPESDYSLKWGEWIEIQNGTRPKCDIVEVECFENNNETLSKSFYKFLHSQIYREIPPQPLNNATSENERKPDVHIIILDSVSSSQFIRSMPKTLHILRDDYESIIFKHHNKNGMNSRPNGYSLLMGIIILWFNLSYLKLLILGKQIYSIAKSPMSRGYEADYKNNEYCTKHLDNDQFIGFRFQDDGYVSMMSEDWALGVFDWEHCVGFKKPAADHYMRPFQIRLEGNATFKSPDLNNIVHKGLCRESHYYPMQYLQDFITVYPDKPKFSITWIANLAHNDVNALYHTDDYFYNFFKSNKEKFENSFVFLMGDHGLRFGDIRETEVGESEDNNPLLFLSIPASLRRNTTLTEILKQNAKNLTTHYDIYATLIEIATPSNPRIPNPLLRGNSLLHPLPPPRTCDNLRIPFESCICKKTKISISNDNPILIPAANAVIKKMNQNLRDLNETNDCVLLTLNPSESIIMNEFQVDGNIKIYEITFNTLPGNGKFWGYVSYDSIQQNFTVLSEKLSRLNMYAEQAQCAIKARFGSYCFCINLLTMTNL
uniref:Uncharacterized protein n=1 Tax=Panagrolaimus sp. ES5 TaxID=591445 RepID=A0AC34F3F1_9BILA